MSISKEKYDALEKEMERLNVFEDDLIEKFILGSGKGGQKLQKTHSCVYLKHKPTGIEVKCSKTRLRDTNRYYARRILCEKLKEKIYHEKTKKQREIAKIRKQKKRRSRRLQEKILEDKRKHSEKKQLRKPPEVK